MASLWKQIVVVLLLAGAAAGAWRWGDVLVAPAAESGRGVRPAPGVVVEAARRERVERAVSAVGAARPAQAVRLAAEAGGRVLTLHVSGGETVAAGDPILALDDAEQRAARAEARAELTRAEAAFARLEALRAQGRVAQADFESAEAEVAVARAALARAEKALADRTLRAPFGGVVGFPEIDAGAVIDPGETVATLDDISALDVDFAAPERFFGAAALDAAVRAESPIFPGEVFEGRVTAIDRRIDPVSRSFQLRARIPNPDLKLPAGAFLRVTLVLDAREGVVAPEESVVVEGGEVYVYVIGPEGRAERRAVRLGRRAPGRVEILDGLAEGERVITRGVQKARDGAPVRVLSDDSVVPPPGA